MCIYIYIYQIMIYMSKEISFSLRHFSPSSENMLHVLIDVAGSISSTLLPSYNSPGIYTISFMSLHYTTNWTKRPQINTFLYPHNNLYKIAHHIFVFSSINFFFPHIWVCIHPKGILDTLLRSGKTLLYRDRMHVTFIII